MIIKTWLAQPNAHSRAWRRERWSEVKKKWVEETLVVIQAPNTDNVDKLNLTNRTHHKQSAPAKILNRKTNIENKLKYIDKFQAILS